jgi:hypothetical protein
LPCVDYDVARSNCGAVGQPRFRAAPRFSV